MSDMEKAQELVRLLIDKNWYLACAESLTGGMLSSTIVDVPGASNTFIEGFVTYSIGAKEETLGIDYYILDRYGAVSRETAAAMAKGAVQTSGAHVSMATTGNAGPDTSEGKPVGLVYTAVDVLGEITVSKHHFSGSRYEIREKTVDAVIEECLKAIKERSG